MTDKIKTQIEGHTAILTLNNPPAHVWDEESLSALPEIVKTLEGNREVYSLIITGDGEKFFSAGADLKLFSDGDTTRARKIADLFGQAFETLSYFRGLTIAAINGYAMGGGLECALACDFRVAEEKAQLALPEATVGLLPCAGGTQNLTRLVGEGQAKRMILLGERIDAKRAFEIGLVEELCANGEALNKARELCKKLEKQSPSSVAACKKLIQATRFKNSAENLATERDLFIDLFSTEDQKEGVNAFLEKRAPQWLNK